MSLELEQAFKKVSEANEQIVEANRMVAEVIMNTYIFTWRWWVSAALIFVPWVAWLIFRDKNSTGRLLCAGFFIMIFSAVWDTIGIENGLWAYPVKVIPSPTLSFSFRLSVLPVIAMLFIQYAPKVNPFLKAIVYGGMSAYVGMPLLSAIDLYKKLHWSFNYSFLILTGMYLVSYYFYNLNSFERVRPKPAGRAIYINTSFFRKKQKLT